MTILRFDLDYTSKDFDALRYRLQDLIRYVFPEWTDFNTANFGNLLLELFAYVGDVITYYQDSNASEAFWPTLTQRISAIRLGSLYDFKLTGASPATGTVRFTLPRTYDSKVVINAESRLQTSDPVNPIQFITTEYKEIAAGSLYVDVPVRQAEVVPSETYESSEEPDYEFTLDRYPVLEDYIEIIAANGSYDKKDNFLESTSTDKDYIVLVDEKGYATIRFGNGVNGTIPLGQISVEYQVGGGVEGNTDANKINILLDPASFSGGTLDSQVAPLTVTNSAAASGGTDRMSLDQARLLAPASLRALYRSITKDDFENAALSVSGIARALMVTSNEYSGITENTGKLYVVAQGAKLDSGRIEPDSSVSSELLSTVTSRINDDYPPALTFQFETLAASFLEIGVRTTVYLDKTASATTVGANIRAALQDFFAVQLESGAPNTDIDFGANLQVNEITPSGSYGEIPWSSVFNAIRDVEGVRKVDEGINGLLIGELGKEKRESIKLSAIQFPKLSSIVIVDGDTGSAL